MKKIIYCMIISAFIMFVLPWIDVFRELENLKIDLKNLDTEKLNELCLNVMESGNTEEALMKIEDYRHEYLPSLGMKME